MHELKKNGKVFTIKFVVFVFLGLRARQHLRSLAPVMKLWWMIMMAKWYSGILGPKVSRHLSYRWGKTPKKSQPGNLSRPGIEPGPAAWQARMLPPGPQRWTIKFVRTGSSSYRKRIYGPRSEKIENQWIRVHKVKTSERSHCSRPGSTIFFTRLTSWESASKIIAWRRNISPLYPLHPSLALSHSFSRHWGINLQQRYSLFS